MSITPRPSPRPTLTWDEVDKILNEPIVFQNEEGREIKASFRVGVKQLPEIVKKIDDYLINRYSFFQKNKEERSEISSELPALEAIVGSVRAVSELIDVKLEQVSKVVELVDTNLSHSLSSPGSFNEELANISAIQMTVKSYFKTNWLYQETLLDRLAQLRILIPE